MTEQYKVGDKVLVEAEIADKSFAGGFHVRFPQRNVNTLVWSGSYGIRHYTPRQEFESLKKYVDENPGFSSAIKTLAHCDLFY